MPRGIFKTDLIYAAIQNYFIIVKYSNLLDFQSITSFSLNGFIDSSDIVKDFYKKPCIFISELIFVLAELEN